MPGKFIPRTAKSKRRKIENDIKDLEYQGSVDNLKAPGGFCLRAQLKDLKTRYVEMQGVCDEQHEMISLLRRDVKVTHTNELEVERDALGHEIVKLQKDVDKMKSVQNCLRCDQKDLILIRDRSECLESTNRDLEGCVEICKTDLENSNQELYNCRIKMVESVAIARRNAKQLMELQEHTHRLGATIEQERLDKSSLGKQMLELETQIGKVEKQLAAKGFVRPRSPNLKDVLSKVGIDLANQSRELAEREAAFRERIAKEAAEREAAYRATHTPEALEAAAERERLANEEAARKAAAIKEAKEAAARERAREMAEKDAASKEAFAKNVADRQAAEAARNARKQANAAIAAAQRAAAREAVLVAKEAAALAKEEELAKELAAAHKAELLAKEAVENAAREIQETREQAYEREARITAELNAVKEAAESTQEALSSCMRVKSVMETELEAKAGMESKECQTLETFDDLIRKLKEDVKEKEQDVMFATEAASTSASKTPPPSRSMSRRQTTTAGGRKMEGRKSKFDPNARKSKFQGASSSARRAVNLKCAEDTKPIFFRENPDEMKAIVARESPPAAAAAEAAAEATL